MSAVTVLSTACQQLEQLNLKSSCFGPASGAWQNIRSLVCRAWFWLQLLLCPTMLQRPNLWHLVPQPLQACWQTIRSGTGAFSRSALLPHLLSHSATRCTCCLCRQPVGVKLMSKQWQLFTQDAQCRLLCHCCMSLCHSLLLC